MITYYIPNGPKNLAPMFPTLAFGNLKQYYIKVKDAANTVIATLPITLMNKNGCCDDHVRLRFLNYCGTIDGIDFNVVTNEHESKSDFYRKPLVYPLSKTNHAIGRNNVTGNNTITLSNLQYGESDMNWINELIDSPLCWMEFKGIQGQSDSYISLTIIDTKILNRKDTDRYVNEIILQVQLSNDKFIIRS